MKRNDQRHRVVAVSLSLLVGTGLMAAKFYAYWLTNSSAILSDALESIINVVASGFALGSILLADKPPDKSHPYGHGKIEYFSAGFEGALIVFAAFGIVHAGWNQIRQPHELPDLAGGLWILLGATVVNLLLGLGLLRVGTKSRSLTLMAEGKHVLTDVYTSLGVLLGLAAVQFSGWYWMDGAIACLVAFNILYIGVKLIRESFAGLMDASDPELLEKISFLISKHRKETWIDIHRLRAWRSGNRIHVDFHLILPRDLTLDQAHKEATEIEEALGHHLGRDAETLIHAEPCIDSACPICAKDPCELRREETSRRPLWYREVLTSDPGREEDHALTTGDENTSESEGATGDAGSQP
ncbi:MAG: cation transporter [Syntrophobacteraceae bacterium]|nr:cation transporter [Syntrophobacteraceae bacterium]